MTSPRRTIRSFVCRAGRMTQAQQQAIQDYAESYLLPTVGDCVDSQSLFKHPAPCILEIGFGMGQSLLTQAAHNLHYNYLGIDVHRPGVGNLLKGLADQQLTNVKVFCADAVEILQQRIADNSLLGIQIFFPDPWPKKRHHKRRLIQPEFVELLQHKLMRQGWLHLATDWAPYAEHMLQVLSAMPGLKNQAGEHQFIARPATRPLTKFEARGQRLGHEVFDLMFVKV